MFTFSFDQWWSNVDETPRSEVKFHLGPLTLAPSSIQRDAVPICATFYIIQRTRLNSRTNSRAWDMVMYSYCPPKDQITFYIPWSVQPILISIQRCERVIRRDFTTPKLTQIPCIFAAAIFAVLPAQLVANDLKSVSLATLTIFSNSSSCWYIFV